MKKTAFLQALVIVVLLIVSWAAFMFRRVSHESAREEPTLAAEDSSQSVRQENPDLVVGGPPQDSSFNEPGIGASQPLVPPSWREWIDYLASQQSGQNMRAALDALKDTLFSMEEPESIASILELFNSQVDIQTGLLFQVGPSGNLLGAGSLRTLLADWLGQLDPAGAAALGKAELEQLGTALNPDLYVIHLRNYTRGTLDSSAENRRFVRAQFDQLLTKESWIRQPTHSVAEAMDFAVYLGQPDLISSLSRFMQPGDVPPLGHAAAIAVERIVDADPAGAGMVLIESIGQSGMSPLARAGYVARLNPGKPDERVVIERYLTTSTVSQEEISAFFQYLPNLNRVLSHNLISPEIPITGSDNPNDRLSAALLAVRDWRANPAFSNLNPVLATTEARLLAQLQGQPAP